MWSNLKAIKNDTDKWEETRKVHRTKINLNERLNSFENEIKNKEINKKGLVLIPARVSSKRTKNYSFPDKLLIKRAKDIYLIF